MSDTSIPFCKATLCDDEIKAVSEVIASGWLTTGPNVKGFEDEFKDYLGSKSSIALNSCTGGLHCVLTALGIGAGDEVITTTFTFVATGHVIAWTGAKPVLVDIDPKTFNIDPKLIEKAITPRTKAIMPVHFGGLSCDMDEINAIANKHNIPVIEDAAHGLGGEYKGKKLGNIGLAGAFSFYPTKNITTGEGGMVVTNDEELAGKIRQNAFFGIDKEVWERFGKKNAWEYNVVNPGFKYNMPDMAAVIGRVQLKKVDNLNNKRKEIAEKYMQAFSPLKDILTLPSDIEDGKHSWHLFPLLIEKGNRDDFIDHLKERNVGTGVHYIPLHFFDFYQKSYGYNKGDFPHAESVFRKIVSIPLFPSLTEEEIERVINAVYSFFDVERT